MLERIVTRVLSTHPILTMLRSLLHDLDKVEPNSDLLERINTRGLDYEERGETSSHWIARHVCSCDAAGPCESAIQFHATRLRQYLRAAWERIAQTQGNSALSPRECQSVAAMLLAEVMGHEQYHLYCHSFRAARNQDLSREGFDRHIEEALATAWGWRVGQLLGFQLGLSPSLVEASMRSCFDHIHAPGYREWGRYAQRCAFEAEALNYSGKDIPTEEAAARSLANCTYQLVDGADRGVPELSTLEAWPRGQAASHTAVDYMGNRDALRSSLYSIKPYSREIDLSGRTLRTTEEVVSALSVELGKNSSLERTVLCLCHNEIESLHRIHHGIKAMKLPLSLGDYDLCLRHQSGNEHSSLLPQKILGLFFLKPRPQAVFFDDPEACLLWARHSGPDGNVHELQEALIDAGLGKLAAP